MAKIFDMSIDFPEIVGKSTRQVWYATQLRETYVSENEDRFRKIDELVCAENDSRSIDYVDEKLTTFSERFSEIEKVVLFCYDAGVIISKLKKEI